MQIIRNRRSFLTGLSAIGAAGLLRTDKVLAASEPPLETTAVRFAGSPAYLHCAAMGRREAVARRWLHRGQLCGKPGRPYLDGPDGARRHGFHCRLRDCVGHIDR